MDQSSTEFAPALSAARSFKSSLLAPFVIYALLIGAAFPFYRFLTGPDAISYISVAEHYLHGRWVEAVNPYWSPLISWLMVPLLAIGAPGLIAVKLICIGSGFGALWSFQTVARALDLRPRLALIALCTAAFMTASYALTWITPDLLETAILLCYFGVFLSSEYGSRRYSGLLCGILGIFAYLAKAYGFYFFLVHFSIASLALWWGESGYGRKRIAHHYQVGLFVFLLGCAPWIAAVSLKAGGPTVSTASVWNHRLVGPDSPGFPQFYGLMPPSNPHALSMWENPSPELLPSWSPLRSAKGFKQQIRLLDINSRGVLIILNHASVLGLSALFVYFIWAVGQSGYGNYRPLIVLVTIAILPAGYMLVVLRDGYVWDDRYFWTGLLLVFIVGLLSIQAAERLIPMPARRLAVALFALSFPVGPVWNLIQGRNAGRALAKASAAVRGDVPAGSRLASCGQWNDGIALASQLRTPYFGVTGPTRAEEEIRATFNPNPEPPPLPAPATPAEIAHALAQNHIDYLFITPGCIALPSADILKSEFAVPGEPEFRLYRLARTH